MGILGSAGRKDEKKYLKLKYATFEGGFFHVFMGKKEHKGKNIIFSLKIDNEF